MNLTKNQTIIAIVAFVILVVAFAVSMDRRNKTRLKEMTEDTRGIEYDTTRSSVYSKFDTDADGHLDEYEMDDYSHYVMDSVMKEAGDKIILDKVKNSLENSGVEITKVRITHDEYSPRWDNIKVNFKNNTGKTIKAIRFRWYDAKNAFGEELNLTYGGGNITETIRPGVQTHGTWETYEDQMESVKAYVSKIVFTDGTEWDNK